MLKVTRTWESLGLRPPLFHTALRSPSSSLWAESKPVLPSFLARNHFCLPPFFPPFFPSFFPPWHEIVSSLARNCFRLPPNCCQQLRISQRVMIQDWRLPIEIQIQTNMNCLQNWKYKYRLEWRYGIIWISHRYGNNPKVGVKRCKSLRKPKKIK